MIQFTILALIISKMTIGFALIMRSRHRRQPDWLEMQWVDEKDQVLDHLKDEP